VVIMADRRYPPVPGIRSVPLADLELHGRGCRDDPDGRRRDAGITEIGAVRVHGGTLIAEFGSLRQSWYARSPGDHRADRDQRPRCSRSAPAGRCRACPGLLAFRRGQRARRAQRAVRLGVSSTAACRPPWDAPWPGFEVLDTVRLARHLMATPQEVARQEAGNPSRGFFRHPRCGRSQPGPLDDARGHRGWWLGELLGRLADRGRGHNARRPRRLARRQGRRGGRQAREGRRARWMRGQPSHPCSRAGSPGCCGQLAAGGTRGAPQLRSAARRA